MLNLLDASPHIASYVKDLAIRLPPKISTEYHILLERLLPKFSDVRRFIVKGFGVSWDNLQPGLQSTLSAFLLRPSLDKLHLIQILAMPRAIMTTVAQTIEVLSVQTVAIKKDDDIGAAESSSPVTPRLTHLIVSSDRQIKFKALQEVILSAYTPNLRRLAIDESDFSRNVLSAVATTITNLSLDCAGTRDCFYLPRLPQLTSLELKINPSLDTLLPIWLLPTLPQLLDALPALHTLTLNVFSGPHAYKMTVEHDLVLLDASRTTATLSAIDSTLHSAVARCVWDIAFSSADVRWEKTYCALVFTRWRAALERNMVRLREAGALEVRYSERRGYEATLP
ncbi:hypothetical protein B0H13DRAFT_452159 [Mycena leptocephala]|nr:hypothetical protein B0H13DRAFT_452159 [Mycena leptocephala]